MEEDSKERTSALLSLPVKPLTGDRPMQDCPILQLDRDRLVVELHQESGMSSLLRDPLSPRESHLTSFILKTELSRFVGDEWEGRVYRIEETSCQRRTAFRRYEVGGKWWLLPAVPDCRVPSKLTCHCLFLIISFSSHLFFLSLLCSLPSLSQPAPSTSRHFLQTKNDNRNPRNPRQSHTRLAVDPTPIQPEGRAPFDKGVHQHHHCSTPKTSLYNTNHLHP